MRAPLSIACSCFIFLIRIKFSSREKRLIYLIFGIVRNKCVLFLHHTKASFITAQETAARQSVITRLCSLNGAKAIKELAEVLPSQQKQWIRMGRLWGEIWRNNLKRWLLNITLGELGDHPDHTQQSSIKLGAFTNSCFLHPTSSQSFNFCPNALWSAKESTWHRGW